MFVKEICMRKSNLIQQNTHDVNEQVIDLNLSPI
jgi:hypothetical protein